MAQTKTKNNYNTRTKQLFRKIETNNAKHISKLKPMVDSMQHGVNDADRCEEKAL